MKKDRTGEKPLNYEQIKHRVLNGIVELERKNHWPPGYLSQIGGWIWPKNQLAPQGLALASSKWVRRMEADGYLRHTLHPGGDDRLRYLITLPGRQELERLRLAAK